MNTIVNINSNEVTLVNEIASVIYHLSIHPYRNLIRKLLL